MATASATEALADGFRRVANAPALVCGVWLSILVTAVTTSLAFPHAIETAPGDTVSTGTVTTGGDRTRGERLPPPFSVVSGALELRLFGFPAAVRNLRDRPDGAGARSAAVWVEGMSLVVWAALLGGVLTRLAGQRRVGSTAFFSACWRYVFRLCRLGLMGAILHWLLWGPVHGWLFGGLYDITTESLTFARSAVVLSLAFYVIIGLLWLPVSLLFDYASIRAVVEDRRNMIGAILAAARFVRRHLGPVVGLYLLNSLLLLVVVGGYATVVCRIDTPPWLTILVGQAYVIAHVSVTLVFYASHAAYFQSRLAHPTYMATARPEWPEPPEAAAAGAQRPS